MLAREMYSAEYIDSLRQQTGNDPALLERVIYAFGLLEAISVSGLSFCFKGGTALMLLLDEPRRLSTDIDIIVKPGTDIDIYIQKAGVIFPFKSVCEQIRENKSDIEKRHFKFEYLSPRNGRSVTILLDVLFEELSYRRTIIKPICNSLLRTEGDNLSVLMPDSDGLLGDKLTAFAPHTTGIPFGIDKELEIIKQLVDCGTLFDQIRDLEVVKATYFDIVRAELAYRNLSSTPDEVLKDTIDACLCICSRGIPESDYAYYKKGISRIRSHMSGVSFNGNLAGTYAAKVLYLAACLQTGQHSIIRTDAALLNASGQPPLNYPKRFSYMRIVDQASYGYFIEGTRLLQTFGLL